MQFLSRPDPKSSAITLKTWFNAEAAFFELAVPIKLKGVGVVADAILRVCASSIVSLQTVKSPTVPPAIGEAFKSTTLSLGFTLSRPPAVIVHAAATEPLSPSKRSSGVVLDAIRYLSKTTAFSIHIDARDAPPNMQQVTDAASQGLFRTCSTRYHIASMYGGVGGKLADSSDSADTAPPPSYQETTSSPPPPPPPIQEPASKKRPRQYTNTDTERDDISLLWGELRAIKEAQSRVDVKQVQSRVESLETENLKLKQQNKELAQSLVNLQERYDALEDRFAALDSKNDELADTYDLAFSDLGENMDRLEGVVDFVHEGGVRDESLKVIKDAVVQEIMTRLANGRSTVKNTFKTLAQGVSVAIALRYQDLMREGKQGIHWPVTSLNLVPRIEYLRPQGPSKLYVTGTCARREQCLTGVDICWSQNDRFGNTHNGISPEVIKTMEAKEYA
ncbi:hypothetical protein FPCIR_11576 [Fusarium pseudocircinatum]|uniref:Uncharacterized protein n=1 Tax=Fusarium pseudocircinatum TaxID=56676 RepID=A0A8H5KQ60_9HYPO|nr:hypothetical protein FPCIR_11576 [Fusarium pseudocircinatum]